MPKSLSYIEYLLEQDKHQTGGGGGDDDYDPPLLVDVYKLEEFIKKYKKELEENTQDRKEDLLQIDKLSNILSQQNKISPNIKKILNELVDLAPFGFNVMNNSKKKLLNKAFSSIPIGRNLSKSKKSTPDTTASAAAGDSSSFSNILNSNKSNFKKTFLELEQFQQILKIDRVQIQNLTRLINEYDIGEVIIASKDRIKTSIGTGRARYQFTNNQYQKWSKEFNIIINNFEKLSDKVKFASLPVKAGDVKRNNLYIWGANCTNIEYPNTGNGQAEFVRNAIGGENEKKSNFYGILSTPYKMSGVKLYECFIKNKEYTSLDYIKTGFKKKTAAAASALSDFQQECNLPIILKYFKQSEPLFIHKSVILDNKPNMFFNINEAMAVNPLYKKQSHFRDNFKDIYSKNYYTLFEKLSIGRSINRLYIYKDTKEMKYSYTDLSFSLDLPFAEITIENIKTHVKKLENKKQLLLEYANRTSSQVNIIGNNFISISSKTTLNTLSNQNSSIELVITSSSGRKYNLIGFNTYEGGIHYKCYIKIADDKWKIINDNICSDKNDSHFVLTEAKNKGRCFLYSIEKCIDVRRLRTFPNNGNFCFFNSLINIIFNYPLIVEQFEKKKELNNTTYLAKCRETTKNITDILEILKDNKEKILNEIGKKTSQEVLKVFIIKLIKTNISDFPDAVDRSTNGKKTIKEYILEQLYLLYIYYNKEEEDVTEQKQFKFLIVLLISIFIGERSTVKSLKFWIEYRLNARIQMSESDEYLRIIINIFVETDEGQKYLSENNVATTDIVNIPARLIETKPGEKKNGFYIKNETRGEYPNFVYYFGNNLYLFTYFEYMGHEDTSYTPESLKSMIQNSYTREIFSKQYNTKISYDNLVKAYTNNNSKKITVHSNGTR